MAYTSDMPRKKEEPKLPTTVRLPLELHDRLKTLAESEYRTINQQIILCIERCLSSPRLPSGGNLTADPKEPYNPTQ